MKTLVQPINWAKLKTLSKSERIGLAQAILDTVVEDEKPLEFTGEFLAELQRRSARAKSHPEELVSWDDVQKELAQRYPKKPRGRS